MGKHKRYIPQHGINPAKFKAQLDALSDKVERQQRVIDMIALSYDRHIDLLSNFARHDIGNAVQNLYAAIEMSDDKDMAAIKIAADAVNKALNTFEDIVPYSADNSFELSKLMLAVETLCRSNFSLHGIQYRFVYDRQHVQKINQPFQQLLQLLQNMVINSIRAMKDSPVKEFVLEAEVIDDDCIIRVKDTGCGIQDENLDRIFEYKFTTTEGGTGIGLFHAKYIADNLNGEISVDNKGDYYHTIFTIKFPKDGRKEDIGGR